MNQNEKKPAEVGGLSRDVAGQGGQTQTEANVNQFCIDDGKKRKRCRSPGAGRRPGARAGRPHRRDAA
jgi:hypothetical protein